MDRSKKIEILKKIKAGIMSPDILNFELGGYTRIKGDIYKSGSNKKYRYSELMEIVKKNNLKMTTPISFVGPGRPESKYPDMFIIYM